MKHSIYLLAALLLAACTSDDMLSTHDGGQGISSTVPDYLEDEPLTRTSLTPTSSGLTFAWLESDRIGIYGSSDDMLTYRVKSVGTDSHTATFVSESFSLNAGTTYYAFNPCPLTSGSRTNVPVSYTGQTQSANGDYTQLGTYDYMTATTTADASGNADFSFKHLSAVMRVKVTLPAAGTYQSLTLTSSDTPFVTDGTVDVTASEPAITSTSTCTSLTLTLGDDAGITLTSDNLVLTTYLTVAPADMSSATFTVDVVSSAGVTYSGTVAGKNMAKGKAYGYAVTASAPEPKMTSLFVATDRHNYGNYFTTLVQKSCSYTDVPDPTVVILGGDNVGSGNTDAPGFSFSTLKSEAESGLGTDDFTFLGTYGSHDDGCTDGYSAFFSGPKELDGYYAYGISYSQMINATSVSSDTQNLIDKDDPYGNTASVASAKFTQWISSLGSDDHKPIVIVSHVPLHYRRGDNYGAYLWATAINAAASSHDIIFFWGHNHTNESSNDTKCYLLAPDEKMTVQAASSSSKASPRVGAAGGPGGGSTNNDTNSSSTESITLNFYYANAGYIKASSNAHLVTFIDDDADGTYDWIDLRKFNTSGSYVTLSSSVGKSYPYKKQLTWCTK